VPLAARRVRLLNTEQLICDFYQQPVRNITTGQRFANRRKSESELKWVALIQIHERKTVATSLRRSPQFQPLHAPAPTTNADYHVKISSQYVTRLTSNIHHWTNTLPLLPVEKRIVWLLAMMNCLSLSVRLFHLRHLPEFPTLLPITHSCPMVDLLLHYQNCWMDLGVQKANPTKFGILGTFAERTALDDMFSYLHLDV